MEFKEIDALFDGALKRLQTGTAPAAPYGEPPLASDHFLLKRSWEYFKQRAAAMEAEWKQILQAKDDEIRALQDLLRMRDERLGALEEVGGDAERLEEAFVRASLDDQRQFTDAAGRLRDRWEEERAALIHAVDDASARVQAIRKEAEARLASSAGEAAALKASLDGARAEVAMQAEKRLSAEMESAAALAARDELIRSLESKVDLLRSEFDRRVSASQDVAERHEALRKDNEAAAAALAKAKAEVAERDDRLRLAAERLDVVQRELESTRASWKREQAEWRELWERSREMWEKRSRGETDSSTETGG